ncbi:MAG: glycosyltransferase family 39 protein [Planctomycetota bacterium]
MSRAVIALVLAVLCTLRIAVAAQLQLFGDEAFYWWCGQRLAPAFADHPFMTAGLVRAGTELFGDTPLGVRSLFLLLGALLPLWVWLLARPLVGARDALLAAGLSLCLPMVGVTLALATPDTPLLSFALLAILGFERATRTNRPGAWLLWGLATGLGLCTHYRFALVPAAALLWLVCTRAGRSQWVRPGLWLSGGVALLGTLPAVSLNWQVDLASLQYQFRERHAADPGPLAWLLHPGEQAIAASPLLYVALLGALVWAVRRARRGDDRAALLVAFGGLPMACFFLMSPWTDVSHNYWHWPQLGYAPLLILTPGVLRRWSERGGWRRVGAIAAPVLGLSLLLVLMVDALTARTILPLRGFSGWAELTAAVRERLPELVPAGADPGPALIIADNYVAGSQLAFALGDRVDVYVLDHPLNRKHGRGLQFRLWGKDEAGLAQRAGESALLILEPTALKSADDHSSLGRALTRIESGKPCGELRVGKRQFEFHCGRVRQH